METALLLLSLMTIGNCLATSPIQNAINLPSENIPTLVVDGDKGTPDKINENIDNSNVQEIKPTQGTPSVVVKKIDEQKPAVGCVTPVPETTTTQATTTTETIPPTTTTEEEGSGEVGSGSGDGSGETVDTEKECQGGFIFISELNRCYLFSKVHRDWHGAEQSCMSVGSSLAAIQTEEENNYLLEQVRKRGTADYFIGGSDPDKEFDFRWEPDQTPITFTHWAPEEPNDQFGVERCMEIKYYLEYSKHFWNDVPCSGYKKNFICEMAPNPLAQ